ncbi:c-type cytochrome [Actibacterium sp. D379-3]
MNIKILSVGALAVVAGGVALFGLMPQQAPASAKDALVSVAVPDLSPTAQMGQAVFNAKCAACHGDNAAGRDGMGPPLIHKIYEPGHHGDGSFVRAARQGVKSHHWRFGNMPPVKGVTDAEIGAVITYVREVQQANGIY